MRKAVLGLLFAWLIAFYAVPIAVAAGFSFLTPRTFGGVDFVPTLQNYAFGEGTLRAFARTAGMAAITGAVCAAAGLLIAGDALLRPSPAKERAILGLAVFSLVVNSLMKVYAWALLLPGWDPWTATLVGMIHAHLPLAMLLTYEGVRSIDAGLLRAARDLGAGEGALWTRVILPLSMPFAIGAASVTVVFVFADFLVPQVLGRGRILLTGNRMSDLFAQQSNWPGMLAIGTVVLVLLFATLAAIRFKSRPA
jgi:spermidine/putrescine transport system permease protein